MDDKPKNAGNRGKGRPKGAKNKLTGAHGDLIHAWDMVAGPETARKLMKSALEEALGREVPIIRDGEEVGTRIVKDFEPLRSILPYIARKMPETVELGPIETMDLDEIARLWDKRQDK